MSSLLRRMQRKAARKSPEWKSNAPTHRMDSANSYSVYRPTKGWLRVGPLRAKYVQMGALRG